MKITKQCVCGKEFETADYRLRDGRGKFCSKECQYSHAYRPNGLTYNIKVENKGWFNKGHQLTVGRTVSKEQKEKLSKMYKGKRFSPETEFRKGETKGVLNPNWKGDEVGYYALHSWLRREYGIPDKCEHCDSTENIEWASKDYSYTRNRDAWHQLCFKCHREYDSANGWGVATKLYPNLNKNTCA